MLDEIEKQVRDHYGLNEEANNGEKPAAETEKTEKTEKPKKAKKAEVISEDDEDILIIPSDAYTLEDEDEEEYEEE